MGYQFEDAQYEFEEVCCDGFENNVSFGSAECFPPRSLGSTTAPLVDLLRQGRYDVCLTESER